MDKKLEAFCQQLEGEIQAAYESSVSISEAEKLAAKFLSASLRVGAEMQSADLDRRMKKAGLKTVKAAVYLENATKGEKKPSDRLLEAIVDESDVVNQAQLDFDRAEVYCNRLDNYLGVFKEAHIFFRGVSKGNYE